MKHRFLSKWNMLLGSLSLLLAGCGSTQKTGKPISSEHQIMALYGVPIEQFEPLPANEADTIADRPTQAPKAPSDDNTQNDTTVRRDPRIMVMYGVPFPRN
ncbi:MAG: hypothetical protein ACI4TV_02225 [Paludibacteraceae bacterium]